MQVTDLLLSDGRQWVNGVKPGVEPTVLCQLGVAGVLELLGVLNGVDVLDEVGAQG